MEPFVHQDHFHGSDLEVIEARYGIRKEEIKSFSANVNPLGISPRLKTALETHIEAIESYPDRAYTKLRNQVASYTGADPAGILIGNGTTEFISLFVTLQKPRHALILGPTYSEYEREISLAGGITSLFALSPDENFALTRQRLEEQLTEDVDLFLLCNPNNPTSTFLGPEALSPILWHCRERGIFVIIDETYAEFVEGGQARSAVSLLSSFDNLLILRGTSKFFAVPGLRLGYALTGDPELPKRVDAVKSPWMVHSLAAEWGGEMFSDAAYIEETVSLITRERARCYEAFLADDRFLPFAPQANFMLVRCEDPSLSADLLFERCIKERMLIRNCKTFPFLDERYFRFCFLKEEDNRHLLEVLLEP